MFTYRSLTAADAQEWREIFVTGVKNFPTGFLMTPAIAAVFMSASTVIVAINAQPLRFYRRHA